MVLHQLRPEFSTGVSHGAAPTPPGVLPAVHPVRAAVVGDPLEDEGEDAGVASRGSGHRHTVGPHTVGVGVYRGCCGGGGGGGRSSRSCSCSCSTSSSSSSCCGGCCCCCSCRVVCRPVTCVGTDSLTPHHMFPGRGDVGGAPGLAVRHPGHRHVSAGVVHDPLVSEGEEAGGAGDGGAGGGGEELGRTGGELGVGTVAPVVDDHRPIGVHLGGAPRGGGAGVCTLIVLHPQVGEGEDTGLPGCGEAGIGNSAAQTHHARPGEVQGAALHGRHQQGQQGGAGGGGGVFHDS